MLFVRVGASSFGYSDSPLSRYKESGNSFQSGATADEFGKVQTLNDRNFGDAVLRSREVVLVSFWAEWARPSKREKPILEALAADYAGQVKIGRLNVDENPRVTNEYQVRGIPTTLLFKRGVVVESVVGLVPEDKLKGIIDKHLK